MSDRHHSQAVRQKQPDSSTLSAAQSRPSLSGKTVVIADDDPIIVEYLDLRCRHLGMRVETAYDGLKAVLKVGKARPDLLILDLNLPDVEGFRVMERLSDRKFAPVPVIVLTARADDAAIQRCKDLHAYYVHKSEETWNDLEPLIFEILRNSRSEPKTEPVAHHAAVPRILLVDDDSARLRSLTQGLQKYPVEVIHGSSGMEGFLIALKIQPDLIVTNYDMEQGSGHYLLSRIKSTRSTQHIPVIVYSGTAARQGSGTCDQQGLDREGPSCVLHSETARRLRPHRRSPQAYRAPRSRLSSGPRPLLADLIVDRLREGWQGLRA